jgi:hypothetical protein
MLGDPLSGYHGTQIISNQKAPLGKGCEYGRNSLLQSTLPFMNFANVD